MARHENPPPLPSRRRNAARARRLCAGCPLRRPGAAPAVNPPPPTGLPQLAGQAVSANAAAAAAAIAGLRAAGPASLAAWSRFTPPASPRTFAPMVRPPTRTTGRACRPRSTPSASSGTAPPPVCSGISTSRRPRRRPGRPAGQSSRSGSSATSWTRIRAAPTAVSSAPPSTPMPGRPLSARKLRAPLAVRPPGAADTTIDMGDGRKIEGHHRQQHPLRPRRRRPAGRRAARPLRPRRFWPVWPAPSR